NAQQTKTIDVSSLKTGNYFLKINSDKGTSSVKFVKM
ncbi:T9SS type A sorting domain-containing protein, partial [Flavobacterium sp.]